MEPTSVGRGLLMCAESTNIGRSNPTMSVETLVEKNFSERSCGVRRHGEDAIDAVRVTSDASLNRTPRLFFVYSHFHF
jgi:hypothetical protein